MMKYFFGILILTLAFASCGTTRRFHNTSEFALIHSTKDLEGHFLNRSIADIESGCIRRTRGILSIFYDLQAREYANFFTIEAKSPNEIKLIYYNDSAERQEKVFEGRMRGNFFEIYLIRRTRIIPLIFAHSHIHRVRIAKTADKRLFVEGYINNAGHFLFLVGGVSHSPVAQFPFATEYKGYIPVHENGLWGFADSYGNIVIPKRFDFVTTFHNGVAYVRLNDKWGLINKQGEEVIPVKYDRLEPFDRLYPPRFRATISGRTGILDINGNEVVPVIYDDITFWSCANGFVRIRLNGKFGFADRNGVVIPAIYSRLRWQGFGQHGHNNANRILVERDGRLFFVDIYGYEYEVSRWGSRLPETRRKIQFDEQRIEISD